MKQTITALLAAALLTLTALALPAAARELPGGESIAVQGISFDATDSVAQPADPGDGIVVLTQCTDMTAGDGIAVLTTSSDMTAGESVYAIDHGQDIYIFSTSSRYYAAGESARTAVSAQANTAGGPVTVTGLADAGFAARVVELVNNERGAAGLAGLTVDATLTAAAQQRALELQLELSHTRPDGTSWTTVCAGVNAENIAMGQTSPDAVMSAWMNSQGHRENILWSQVARIGVSCVEINGSLYWVQLFGI